MDVGISWQTDSILVSLFITVSYPIKRYPDLLTVVRSLACLCHMPPSFPILPPLFIGSAPSTINGAGCCCVCLMRLPRRRRCARAHRSSQPVPWPLYPPVVFVVRSASDPSSFAATVLYVSFPAPKINIKNDATKRCGRSQSSLINPN